MVCFISGEEKVPMVLMLMLILTPIEGGWVMVRFEELGRESFLQAHLTRLLEEQWWQKQGQVCGLHPWHFWGSGSTAVTSILRDKMAQWGRAQALEADLASLGGQLYHC